MKILFTLAVLPVILLGFYIYKKDNNKEPEGLLFKIFFFGVLTCIPVLICELAAGEFFDTEDSSIGFISMFINVFFGVGLIEEIFKWFVTRKFGYKSKEYDEVYDIIVYSVFASLGFACIENILYVFSNGIGTAIARALLSVPGHACFGVIMGYFLSKAKLNELHGNTSKCNTNLLLSIVMPSLVHTMYDALLFDGSDLNIIIFFIFDIFMVIYCFSLVRKMSSIQYNVSIVTGQVTSKTVEPSITLQDNTKNMVQVCPICKRKYMKGTCCPSCGYRNN